MEQTDLLLPHRGLPPAEEECLGSATLLSTSLGSESLLPPLWQHPKGWYEREVLQFAYDTSTKLKLAGKTVIKNKTKRPINP